MGPEIILGRWCASTGCAFVHAQRRFNGARDNSREMGLAFVDRPLLHQNASMGPEIILGRWAGQRGPLNLAAQASMGPEIIFGRWWPRSGSRRASGRCFN